MMMVIGESTGDIKLTLNADRNSAATYRLGSVIEGGITILDDDAPELKIAAGNPKTEATGVSADFIVSAEVSPDDHVTVWYNLTESQNFLDNEGDALTQSLDFTNEATEATLAVPLVSDDTAEDNGTVTITLIADRANEISYFAADSPNNTAAVIVYDDDSPPTIMIDADSGDVAENIGMAEFNLTATGLTGTTTIMVNATPSEDGADFLTDAIADTAKDFPVEFTDPDGDSTFNGTLSVTLDEDEVREATGDIKLTLNASAQVYRLGSTTEGVITIWDNDAPELKVTAGEPVAEAENAVANFIISAEVSPNDFVNVQYDLAESQDFIDNEGTGKTARLDFSNGAKEATLPIAITSDDTTES